MWCYFDSIPPKAYNEKQQTGHIHQKTDPTLHKSYLEALKMLHWQWRFFCLSFLNSNRSEESDKFTCLILRETVERLDVISNVSLLNPSQNEAGSRGSIMNETQRWYDPLATLKQVIFRWESEKLEHSKVTSSPGRTSTVRDSKETDPAWNTHKYKSITGIILCCIFNSRMLRIKGNSSTYWGCREVKLLLGCSSSFCVWSCQCNAALPWAYYVHWFKINWDTYNIRLCKKGHFP